MKRYAILALAVGLAMQLVLTAPMAMAASSSQRSVPALKAPPPVLLPAEEEDENYRPEFSGQAQEELKLILARDMMPIMTHYLMAEFIWQADPVAACDAAKAVAAASIRLKASVAALRETVIQQGYSPEALDGRFGGMLDTPVPVEKMLARFCERMVPQKLSAQDVAAFKKGGAMLNTVMSEMSDAVSAKVAGDHAQYCVNVHMVAATGSDFEDFIAAEATTSEVMKVMKRSRVMRMTAQLRELAAGVLGDCQSE